MFGDLGFSDTRWVQEGVFHVVKNIPNEPRFGVLAPEVLQATRNGQTAQYGDRKRTAEARIDYVAMRKRTPPNKDITTVPLSQWEFDVPSSDASIPVTACCRADRLNCIKPAVVYFHGGGWRWGSRRIVQNPMRLLAQLSGALVLNVEYRQAPEYMYPCATDDCWHVLKHVARNATQLGIDDKWIIVSGDSAGGNLAAACARRDRNMRTRLISGQVLIYPALTLAQPEQSDDYHFSLDDYCYDDSQAQWIVSSIQAMDILNPGNGLYAAARQDEINPDASPLLDADFSGLPDTLLICAEYDFLTQQCRTYAKRLAKAGGQAELMIYRGTNHGFMTRVGIYPQATDLMKEFSMFICKQAHT